jgi:Flp pilus assembly protein TadG
MRLVVLQYNLQNLQKAATLALAKYLSDSQINLKDINRIQALAIVFLPVMLIYHNQILGAYL